MTRDLFIALLALVATLLSIGVPTPWTGPAFLGIITVLFFAGYGVTSFFEDDRTAHDKVDAARVLVVSTGVGLGVALLLWTASAYLTKELPLGSILLVATAVGGGVRYFRKRPSVGAFFSSKTALLLSAIALLTGFYVYGINEIEWGNRVVFTYRMDWWAHISMAALIDASGLPLISPHGSPAFPYLHASHVGYPVLLAGIADLTRITHFQAARVLLMLGYWLIPLSAWCVVHHFGLGRAGVVIASLGGLFASGLCLPYSIATLDYKAILDPYVFAPFRMNAASGSMYHNGTQLVSVALTAVAMTAFDRFRQHRRILIWVLTAFLLACSGLVKPSAFIIFGPALLIGAVIEKKPWLTVLAVVSVFTVAVLVYLLPSFLHPVKGAGVAWVFTLGNIADSDKTLPLLNLLGMGIISVVYWFVRRPKQIVKDRAVEWFDVAVVGLLGGLVFALFFTEQNREFHGNQNWSAIAGVIIASPLLLGYIIQLVHRTPDRTVWGRAVRLSLMLLVCAQLLQAAIYLAAYPHLNPSSVRRGYVTMVERIRRYTRPGDRLLVDPDIARGTAAATLRAFLGRPVLFDYSTYPPAVRREARRWNAIVEKKSKRGIPQFLKTRDAVVIGNKTKFLRKDLMKLKWKPIKIDPAKRFTLWRSH